jgi:hypothetical protein
VEVMSDNCKHRNVVTFLFADNGRPAGLWACEYCGHKFVPIDLAMEREAERYLALRSLCLTSMAPVRRSASSSMKWEQLEK